MPVQRLCLLLVEAEPRQQRSQAEPGEREIETSFRGIALKTALSQQKLILSIGYFHLIAGV
jgi:hypothetical protein